MLSYLDIVSHGHAQQVQGEHLQSLKWEGVPGAVDEGVTKISDTVHAEGQDEDVDTTHLANNPVRVEEKWY